MRVINVIDDEMELKTTLTKILLRYKCTNYIMHYVFVHNNVFIFSLYYLSPPHNLFRNIFSLRGAGGCDIVNFTYFFSKINLKHSFKLRLNM